ncbi:MAG TPA: hypothetical protein VFA46_18560 [Actinomycetes bacterium]|jgi:hypothetical protein|nr:hypothetical protein [Actinomycetes bacterium]
MPETDLGDELAGLPAERAPGRRRRRLAWVLVALAVVALLAAVGLLGAVGLTFDGNTLVRGRGYSFELPGRWWPSPGDRGAVENAVAFYRGPATAAGRLHVTVTRERRATTLRELERLVPFRVATTAHGKIVKRLSRVRLGGEDAIQLDYEFSSDGTRTYTRQILCPHDGAVYSVMILAVPYLGSGFDQTAGSVTRQVLGTWGWRWRWT